MGRVKPYENYWTRIDNDGYQDGGLKIPYVVNHCVNVMIISHIQGLASTE